MALRRGAALLITLILTIGVVSMLGIASDSILGMHALEQENLAQLRATYAADAVAAMIEARLASISTRIPELRRPITSNASTFFNLQGCWSLPPSMMVNYQPSNPKAQYLWYNGCAVRWRLEPATLFDKTSDKTAGVTNGTQFFVNSAIDDAQAAQDRDAPAAAHALPGTTLYPYDLPYFYFRIVTEAWAMSNPNLDINYKDLPWNQATSAASSTANWVSHVQARRIVELKVVQLFDYALLGLATGPQGDIDLQVGGAVSIQHGTVHSNAAIYIRGGESAGFPGNYHRMASGDNSRQRVILGQADAPIQVEAVGGIYRLSKLGDLLGVNLNAPYCNADPTQIKVQSALGGVALTPLDPNGDEPGSQRHMINGVPFCEDNDSRSKGALQAAFNSGAAQYVFDQNTSPQAQIVNVNSTPLTSSNTNVLDYQQHVPNTAGNAVYLLQDSPSAFDLDSFGLDPAFPWTVLQNLSVPPQSTTPVNMYIKNYPSPGMLDCNFTLSARAKPFPAAGLYYYYPDTGTDAAAFTAPYDILPTFPVVFDNYFMTPATEPWLSYVRLMDTGTSGLSDFLISPAGSKAKAPTLPPQLVGDSFHTCDANGYYLDSLLLGDGQGNSLTPQQYRLFYQTNSNAILSTTNPIASKTGLVIRERRHPIWNNITADRNGHYYILRPWFQSDVTVFPTAWDPASPTATTDARYREFIYLLNNYVVLLAGQNISLQFFGTILSAMSTDQFVASEDEFVDSRQSGYIEGFYHYPGHRPSFIRQPPSGGPGAIDANGKTERPWSQNVLTLNLKQVQLFLQAPVDAGLHFTLHPVHYSDLFSGAIYIHRTRRSLNSAWSPSYRWFDLPTGFMPDFYPGDMDQPIASSFSNDPAPPIYQHVAQNITDAQLWQFDPGYQVYLADGSPGPLFLPAGDGIATDAGTTTYWSRGGGANSIDMSGALEPDGPDDTQRGHVRIRGGLVRDNAGGNPDKIPTQLTPPAFAGAGGWVGSADAEWTNSEIFWGLDPANHQTPAPLSASGLTIITPDRLYLWGNFNAIPHPVTTDDMGYHCPPCSIFADSIVLQSPHWLDSQWQSENVTHRGIVSFAYGNNNLASDMIITSSVLINTVPTESWSAGCLGDFGINDEMETIEDWGNASGPAFLFTGSMVLLGPQQYSHAPLSYVPCRSDAISRTHTPGLSTIQFNTDLNLPDGQPPYAPIGIVDSHLVSTINFNR